MCALADSIRMEISRGGPMTCERFMELALYHPNFGYYTRQDVKRLGRAGDFFTSVSVGPLFGRLMARQFFEMWERLGTPDPFWIVEQGGEDGQLACDILDWCGTQAPDFYTALRYELIESSAPAAKTQRERRRGGRHEAKISWITEDTIETGRTGVFFSNELVDAFPVRRVILRNNEWRELRIAQNQKNGFCWVEFPSVDPALNEIMAALPLPVLEGYTTEINLHARRWMQQSSRVLERGYLLTIDYGFPARIYYAPFRTSGTLSAYINHQRSDDVLRDPGSQDMTAHVDFTALAQAGEKAGLTTLGFLDQQRFLMGIGAEELGGEENLRTGLAEAVRAWQTLIHPSHLGTRFQVLLQSKNASSDLAGLRFSRPDDVSALY